MPVPVSVTPLPVLFFLPPGSFFTSIRSFISLPLQLSPWPPRCLSWPPLSTSVQKKGLMHSKGLETVPPLSASSPKSDRGIRIRIAVHSPQCPSDEPEGARKGGMKGGVPNTRRAPIGQQHSLCFYIAAISFKFVLRILVHIHATHVHARVNIHSGVPGLTTC